MNKILMITTGNKYMDSLHEIVKKHECEEILKKVGTVTNDDFEHAIDVIIAKMCRDKLYCLEVNIDERERGYSPAKEMTIAEIEKELGYKVKIVR